LTQKSGVRTPSQGRSPNCNVLSLDQFDTKSLITSPALDLRKARKRISLYASRIDQLNWGSKKRAIWSQENNYENNLPLREEKPHAWNWCKGLRRVIVVAGDTDTDITIAS
jgi:hypothetical protein